MTILIERLSLACWRAAYAAAERRDAHIAGNRHWHAAAAAVLVALLARS